MPTEVYVSTEVHWDLLGIFNMWSAIFEDRVSCKKLQGYAGFLWFMGNLYRGYRDV